MSGERSDSTTWLYLIRHGATAANECRPYVLQGRSVDLPLSETGRRQAAALGSFLQHRGIEHVYASPLRRAVETAEAIAAPRALRVSTDQRLVECDVGRWEGMDWDSISREYPAEYQAFMDDPAAHPYLGGETYRDVADRVRPAITEVLERHAGRSIAVVAHNVVNRVYLAGLLGLELRRAKDIRQSNGGINLIRHRRGETELMTLNMFFHIADADG